MSDTAPAGTHLENPTARRPRAPKINLAEHDRMVREQEHAPQIEIFETGGDPTMKRNLPVLEHLTQSEREQFDRARFAMTHLYALARERYDFHAADRGKIDEPEPEKDDGQEQPETDRRTGAEGDAPQGAVPPEETPDRDEKREETAEPEDAGDNEGHEEVTDPEPPAVDDDDDETPIDEDEMNAAFAAAMKEDHE